LLVRYEHYIETDPESPSTYERFMGRMAKIHLELDQWATIVLDSLTFMESSARYYSQYKLNRGVKDGRQHYAFSTDAIERIVVNRMGGWLNNVLVIAHVNDSKTDLEGRTLFSVDAPGKMPVRCPAGYSEFYYSYVEEDEKEGLIYCLQTRSNRTHGGASQIDAPNPCLADYEELWANWPEDEEREALHCLNYGPSGVGKSTFAATWPKPMLVFGFDPYAKERPYKRLGRSERIVDEQFNIVVDNIYSLA